MNNIAQIYFVVSVATILIFLASFKATMYFGDVLASAIF